MNPLGGREREEERSAVWIGRYVEWDWMKGSSYQGASSVRPPFWMYCWRIGCGVGVDVV